MLGTPGKEPLSRKESEKIGNVILELVAGCPFIPRDAKVKYNAKDIGKCFYVMTTGGIVKKRSVTGAYVAELMMQIAYQSFPRDNEEVINAQAVVDSVATWMEGVDLPMVTGDRTITKVTAGSSFPSVEEVSGDTATTFATDVVLEYEVG